MHENNHLPPVFILRRFNIICHPTDCTAAISLHRIDKMDHFLTAEEKEKFYKRTHHKAVPLYKLARPRCTLPPTTGTHICSQKFRSKSETHQCSRSSGKMAICLLISLLEKTLIWSHTIYHFFPNYL